MKKGVQLILAPRPPSGLIQLFHYHATRGLVHNLELHLFLLAQDQIQHYYSKRLPTISLQLQKQIVCTKSKASLTKLLEMFRGPA